MLTTVEAYPFSIEKKNIGRENRKIGRIQSKHRSSTVNSMSRTESHETKSRVGRKPESNTNKDPSRIQNQNIKSRWSKHKMNIISQHSRTESQNIGLAQSKHKPSTVKTKNGVSRNLKLNTNLQHS